MSGNSTVIANFYKSRKIILNLIERRGYNVSDYMNFTVNDLHSMHTNKQLDMLISNNDDKKIYVKYNLGPKLSEQMIQDLIEDLFNIEEILKKDDDLIIITQNKLTDRIKKSIDEFWYKEKKFITVYNLHDYLYNILNHSLVPKHKVLNTEKKNDVMKKYNIKKEDEFPEISRYEPVAMALCMRPGQVCEITRNSDTAIKTPYFRLCY